MELKASHFAEHHKFSVAYHPDGDGFGTVNILLNHCPHADIRLYSVDNSRRDFSPEQYEQLKEDMAAGAWVVYLDLTPSNFEQLEDILSQSRLLYLDHHQIRDGFKAMFDRVPAHNPRLYDPENAELYAAGLQIYHLFNQDAMNPDDLPYLFVSLFGDAKFQDWSEFHEQLVPQQAALAKMADALSMVGLTKPLGPYRPENTDTLFNEVIASSRNALAEGDVDTLLASFQETALAKRYHQLQQRIDTAGERVRSEIEAGNSFIHVEDDTYSLVAILLKEAYKTLDFENYHILYQIDQETDTVHYAVMSKGVDYDCAGTISKSPYVTGGGHTDRAGATGPLSELEKALDFFRSASS